MNAPARTALMAVILGAAACGGSSSGSPAAPTTSTSGSTPASSWSGPALSGSWSGSWHYTVSGLKVTDDVRVEFAASGATMAGQLSSAAGVTAVLTFTQPSPMSGTTSLSVVLLNGATCVGNGAMSAALAGDELRVAMPAVTPVSGGCTVWASGSTFVLKRS